MVRPARARSHVIAAIGAVLALTSCRLASGMSRESAERYEPLMTASQYEQRRAFAGLSPMERVDVALHGALDYAPANTGFRYYLACSVDRARVLHDVHLRFLENRDPNVRTELVAIAAQVLYVADTTGRAGQAEPC